MTLGRWPSLPDRSDPHRLARLGSLETGKRMSVQDPGPAPRGSGGSRRARPSGMAGCGHRSSKPGLQPSRVGGVGERPAEAPVSRGKAQAFTSASACHGGSCLWGRVTLCEVAIPQEGLHQHSSGLTGVRREWGGQPGDHGEVSTPLEPTARSALEAEASWAE